MDELFGEKHTSVQNVENVRKGIETIDVGMIEQQLQDEIGLKHRTIHNEKD